MLLLINQINTSIMLNLKKLDMRKTTSTVTIEHGDTFQRKLNHDEVLALAILLGGYNQYGRGIDLEKYQEIKERFDNCITELRDLIPYL